RKPDRLGVALAREPVDRGTAGIFEPEEPSNLVERFSRRVVDGLTEHTVTPVVLHRDQERVTTGDDEGDERWLELRILDHRGVEVGLVMMHRDVRQPADETDRLRRADSDQQRAREA